MISSKKAAAVLCASACLITTACGNNGGNSAATGSSGKTSSAVKAAKGGKPVKVVATTTQICDYVTQIATDKSPDSTLAFIKTSSSGKETSLGAPKSKATSEIDLTCLLAPNASAHNHEMTPAQMKALANADVFFVSGVDLEHFLDKAVKASGFHGTMAVTSGILTTKDIDDINAEKAKEKNLPYKVFRGVDKVKVAPWPFPPAPGEKEPEFRFDPHVWTSPANAMVQVKNIGATLEKVSPESKDVFAAHVKKYEKQLTDLDTWAKKSLDTIPVKDRVLFTSHDAFGYFSKRYGIKFIGSALTDFNAQADATADHIASEAQKVKESGAKALFAENSNNAKSVEAIAKAAGVKAVLGDDALYGDSLGPVGSDGQTYIGSILHNVSNLVIAWGGKVAPIPADIKAYEPKNLVK